MTLLLAAVAAWAAFGRPGHPFDDARACEGSTVALEPALAQAGLKLPVGATDVHYITHSDVSSDGLLMAVAFRSTRTAMNTYLRTAGLVTDGLDSLDDGRFDVGDAGTDPATLHLCGDVPSIGAPAVLIEEGHTRVDGSPETVDVAVRVDDAARGSIRSTTDVLLTVRVDTA